MKLSNLSYVLGFASIALSASQYLSSGSADRERNGLFVGHWAPTFLILGKIIEDRERRGESVVKAD